MALSHILGQPTAIQTLTRALESGHVHHAYRFEGPSGVGKELAAFALARALVCEGGDPLGCERCSSCRRATTLSQEAPQVPVHPDVVLIERGLYSASLLGGQSELTGIGVEQIRRVVLARAGYPPHEGRALVFIVRAAHELTLAAANALLKTLEEPHPRTHFVLLSDRPRLLLDTIRSRTLAVRFAPLPDGVVADLAERHGAPRSIATLGQGSIGQALALADDDAVAARDAFVNSALAALDAPDLASALGFVEQRADDRRGLAVQLQHLAGVLAERARLALDGVGEVPAEVHARRYSEVLISIGELERNAQPGLALEALMIRLRAV